MSLTAPIVIAAPEPGYSRFKVAHDIQNACNTSGVARELIRVIEDAARDPGCGRGRLPHDPAVAAVIDKLASLMRIDACEAHGQCATRSPHASQPNPVRSRMALFRTLDASEEAAFRRWARDNYTPLSPIQGIWHPAVQDECRRINAEAGGFAGGHGVPLAGRFQGGSK